MTSLKRLPIRSGPPTYVRIGSAIVSIDEEGGTYLDRIQEEKEDALLDCFFCHQM